MTTNRCSSHTNHLPIRPGHYPMKTISRPTHPPERGRPARQSPRHFQPSSSKQKTAMNPRAAINREKSNHQQFNNEFTKIGLSNPLLLCVHRASVVPSKRPPGITISRCESSCRNRRYEQRVRLPRPVRHERGEGRGEGCPTHANPVNMAERLLAPTLSSIPNGEEGDAVLGAAGTNVRKG